MVASERLNSMLVYLIIAFTAVPLIELAILIEVGQHIGVGPTLGLVIITGVLGAFLARSQGSMVLIRIRNEMNNGVMPGDSLIDGVMILCGGVLLLTPGLLTDILGFAMVLPYTRPWIKLFIKEKIQKMNKSKIQYRHYR